MDGDRREMGWTCYTNYNDGERDYFFQSSELKRHLSAKHEVGNSQSEIKATLYWLQCDNVSFWKCLPVGSSSVG